MQQHNRLERTSHPPKWQLRISQSNPYRLTLARQGATATAKVRQQNTSSAYMWQHVGTCKFPSMGYAFCYYIA